MRTPRAFLHLQFTDCVVLCIRSIPKTPGEEPAPSRARRPIRLHHGVHQIIQKEYAIVKIAFRRLPFTQEQRACLDRIATAAGYETLWCEDDALPESASLDEIEILMGYFSPDMLKRMPALRWLQTPSAGVERWCGDIYPNADVVLTNCSGAFGVAISEFMLTGLLMLMRNMPAYMANQRAHSWKGAGNCRAIFGSTITVVGMGDIGENSRPARRRWARGCAAFAAIPAARSITSTRSTALPS